MSYYALTVCAEIVCSHFLLDRSTYSKYLLQCIIDRLSDEGQESGGVARCVPEADRLVRICLGLGLCVLVGRLLISTCSGLVITSKQLNFPVSSINRITCFSCRGLGFSLGLLLVLLRLSIRLRRVGRAKATPGRRRSVVRLIRCLVERIICYLHSEALTYASNTAALFVRKPTAAH